MKIKPLHFIIFWTSLNLLQGAFTELTSDEGYYWFFSTSLEWGYYDHPPLTAWLIKAGYSVFQNELGVRLLYILMNSVTLFLFFKLLPNEIKEKKAIYLVLMGLPLLNYMAVIIFPDGPLLFFCLMFLTSYKRFLQKNDLTAAFLTGISIAGMLYSKNTGILIIIFTLVANPKLFKTKYFYLSGSIALLLLIPHILWQINQGYPGVKYHLSGRVSGFTTKHMLEYLSQQLPAIGASLIFIPFVYKTIDPFERTLKYIIAGTFLFFLFMSFYTFVHFHWTSIVIFPLLLLTSKNFTKPERKKWVVCLTMPFILLLLVFRIHLMIPISPVNHVNSDYYHGRKTWSNEITAAAVGKPVIFVEDFKESSIYSFYSGKTAVAVFPGQNRKSQYDIWNYQDSIRQKDVLMVHVSHFNGARELYTSIGRKYYISEISNYSSYYSILVRTASLQRQEMIRTKDR